MSSIVPALQLVNIHQAHCTLQESLVIFLLIRSTPLSFAKSSHTWQYHILCLCKSRYIFCPQISLYTGNVFLFFRSQGRRHWLVAIYSFHRQITSDSQRFCFCILSLIIVKIQVCIRSHDNIMLLACSLNTSGFTSP